MALNIDFNFIAQLEGKCMLSAYVPLPNSSQSGVTLASGFDLGARNVNDLRMLGFKADLIERFKPYLGLKRQEAVEKLRQHPLKISKTECTVIDTAVKNHFVSQLMVQYNASISNPMTKFENLPGGIQTAIISVSFQHGNLRLATRKFWKAITEQDWPRAIYELEHFSSNKLYLNRRLAEAKLIKQAIHTQ